MLDNLINEIGFDNVVRFFKTFDVCVHLIIVFILCYAAFKFISLILDMCDEFKKEKDKAVKEAISETERINQHRIDYAELKELEYFNKYNNLKKQYDDLLGVKENE